MQGPLFQGVSALVLAFVAVFIYLSPLGLRLELTLLRGFFALRGPIAPPPDVVLVAIDDQSYKVFGASTSYPLPRRYIATAFESLQAAKPKVIIVDAKIPNERMIDPDADARIEAALKQGRVAIWNGRGTASAAGAEEVEIPSEERFRKAAAMELPMRLYSVLDEVVFVGNPSSAVDASAPVGERVWHARPLAEIAGYEIVPPGPRDLINYYGGAGTVNSISVHQLVTGDVERFKAMVRDKVVVIGYRSLHFGRGLQAKDEMVTPVSSIGMYGAEIHAQIAGNLIDRSWKRRLSVENELIFVALSVLIMGSMVIRFPRPLTLGVTTLVLGAVCVADYLAFVQANFWLGGVATVLAAFGLVAAISSVYYFLRSEAYRRYLDRTFSFEREREL